MKIFRQGDVLLQQVANLPKGATEVDLSKERRLVLAYGEVTGHAHVIKRTDERLPVKAWDAGAERFIQVVEKTALTHEEHSAITLEPGIYRVVHQREYSPEEIRRVAD